MSDNLSQDVDKSLQSNYRQDSEEQINKAMLLIQKESIQSIRLLFGLSSYAAVGIPLAHLVLPMYRLPWKVHVSTFSIPLKNHID